MASESEAIGGSNTSSEQKTCAVKTELKDSYNDIVAVEEIETMKIETIKPSEKSSKSAETVVLSKRQQKRLLKKMNFLKHRAERREIEKAKKKKRRLETAEKNKAAGILNPPRKKFKLMKESCNKVKVAVDLSLDNLMTEAELGKTVKQIQRCYSENRQAENPLQFYLTSFCNRSKDCIASKQGCLNWDIHYEEKNYIDVFGNANVVYLSSESPNVLITLSEEKCYIIGGLVDHNKHKGLCFKLAEEAGIEHARLPIDEFFEMKTRKVLTINHVFSILLGVSNGSSWEESLLMTLPSRKGAVPKLGETSFDQTEEQTESKCAKSEEET